MNYPPNGLVLLSPLSLLPIDIAVPFWIVLNIGLACAAPYLAARFFRPHDSFRAIALPILMFLCWGGVRTLTQFSLLALTLSMVALVLADRRPIAAGIWLGLAMMKPQLAGPVFLWSVFTRRWRVAVASLLVVGCALCRLSGASRRRQPARRCQGIRAEPCSRITPAMRFSQDSAICGR